MILITNNQLFNLFYLIYYQIIMFVIFIVLDRF